MSDNVILDKKQAKTIAQGIYGDVKGYCHNNFERYVPWLINEIRTSKGNPPMETFRVSPCLLCRISSKDTEIAGRV